MIRVHNRHNASVSRIPPGGHGLVSEADLSRYPWALTPAPEEGPEGGEGEAEVSAREARQIIATASDPDDVFPFVSHPNSAVRAKARRRLRELEGGGEGDE